MAGLRFTDLQSRPTEFLDFTSLTLDEFQVLVPPFETAFHARMAAWRFDGKPRTARRFTVYKNCPLPTPEDRLLFILVSLKTYALQVVHGRLFGMVQGKGNQWIHTDRNFKRHFRPALPGCRPWLTAMVASPAPNGCLPQQRAARLRAAWTCGSGWVALKRQAFRGVRTSARPVLGKAGGGISQARRGERRCRCAHVA